MILRPQLVTLFVFYFDKYLNYVSKIWSESKQIGKRMQQIEKIASCVFYSDENKTFIRGWRLFWDTLYVYLFL